MRQPLPPADIERELRAQRLDPLTLNWPESVAETSRSVPFAFDQGIGYWTGERDWELLGRTLGELLSVPEAQRSLWRFPDGEWVEIDADGSALAEAAGQIAREIGSQGDTSDGAALVPERRLLLLIGGDGRVVLRSPDPREVAQLAGALDVFGFS